MQRSFTQKHWQGLLMAAAAVATLALAAGPILPGLTAGSGSDSTASIGVADSASGGEALPDTVAEREGVVPVAGGLHDKDGAEGFLLNDLRLRGVGDNDDRWKPGGVWVRGGRWF